MHNFIPYISNTLNKTLSHLIPLFLSFLLKILTLSLISLSIFYLTKYMHNFIPYNSNTLDKTFISYHYSFFFSLKFWHYLSLPLLSLNSIFYLTKYMHNFIPYISNTVNKSFPYYFTYTYLTSPCVPYLTTYLPDPWRLHARETYFRERERERESNRQVRAGQGRAGQAEIMTSSHSQKQAKW